MIFKDSGYVFDPAATSSDEEDEPVQVQPAETKADVEMRTAKAAVETESEKPSKAKELTTAPEMKASTTEATENKLPGEVANEPPAVLPATTLGSSSDGSSSASEHDE